MNTISRCYITICFFIVFYSSISQAQELILIGGALKTCSSFSPDYCLESTAFPNDARSTTFFEISQQSLNRLALRWPQDSRSQELLSTLKALEIADSTKRYRYTDLVKLLNTETPNLKAALSSEEWSVLLDTLEVSPLAANGQRQQEIVRAKQTRIAGSKAILDYVSNTIRATPTKQYLAITASSRDPYEASDFYANLFDEYGLSGQWLALTPALAMAVSNGKCDSLPELRKEMTQSETRERVYPERIRQEQLLCTEGISALIAKIKSVDTVIFNGGDQSLTKQVMYDPSGQAYPWLDALQSRPVIIGTSAGTAIQSGGVNQFGRVPMITNGTSQAALDFGAFEQAPPDTDCAEYNKCKDDKANRVTFDSVGGLGTFPYGILDTHFSERSRTFRLATLLNKTGQKLGFGVDETTALITKKGYDAVSFDVLGEHGVVFLEQLTPNRFRYHYLQPQDKAILNKQSKLNVTLAKAVDVEKTNNKFSNDINAIFSKNGFKNVVQTSCRSMESKLVYPLSLKENTQLSILKKTDSKCIPVANGVYSIKNMIFYLDRQSKREF
ncbi:cyanophycinase (plasmid) [Pseudoalteromonas xiamenensis]|uniref:cyanophycinase n=1 Tax=Pseudoalteromonas xiamenensis TaxID=882626 RepID=UPI0027E4477C|nr:cyanophycinase [Pseudoalteromonas xiamenensis]WMN61627.1 cyanophycinase [Pseudoalteromonas xiamenensis]